MDGAGTNETGLLAEFRRAVADAEALLHLHEWHELGFRPNKVRSILHSVYRQMAASSAKPGSGRPESLWSYSMLKEAWPERPKPISRHEAAVLLRQAVACTVSAAEDYFRARYRQAAGGRAPAAELMLRSPGRLAAAFQDVGADRLWHRTWRRLPSKLRARFKDGVALSAAVRRAASGKATAGLKAAQSRVELLKAAVEAADKSFGDS
ncbi:hypothetical protein JXD38_08480 [candidate division WOR-3 bacterium]|nr:hypothetical protein [candidate division WOR-3 bacterium]